MPARQGTNSIVVGQILVICIASCPAPLFICRKEKPFSTQIASLCAAKASSKATGLSAVSSSVLTSTPSAAATLSAASLIACSVRAMLALSTPRTSTHNVTSPGTTFIEPGSISTTPTVPTVPLAFSFVAASFTAKISFAALTSASLRIPIGVAPLWSATPLIFSLKRVGAAILCTMPIALPVCSSTLPCSICSSAKHLYAPSPSTASLYAAGSQPHSLSASIKLISPFFVPRASCSGVALPVKSLLPIVA